MIRLDELPWFARLLRSQGNFGFGLAPIDPEFVTYLEAVAAEASSAMDRP
ncbi:hypothetical protein [Polyangium spumosum]|uniref:Uncharacterized protein n=1 Tax=Polyangium spumosum TaxID=889282 RepID=A0A6N7PQ73_9BACT|nr:hypothetical protein [Polyangium spumosum]MRG92510.1 hypothetical protein [Polyangium spumosum]